MFKILIDQDFDHDILRGLIRRFPELEYSTAFEAGLSKVEDIDLLLWASIEGRVLLTHDRKTMPVHFAALFEQGKPPAGVIIVPRRMPIGQALNELEIIISCSEQEEWRNAIIILPL